MLDEQRIGPACRGRQEGRVWVHALWAHGGRSLAVPSPFFATHRQLEKAMAGLLRQQRKAACRGQKLLKLLLQNRGGSCQCHTHFSMFTGGRCRLQRPWGGSSLLPHK